MSRVWLVVGLVALLGTILAGCGEKPTVDVAMQPGAGGCAVGDGDACPGNCTEGCPEAVSGSVRVFVPCGMIIPVRAVMDKFEADNPDVTLEGVFDNAVILAEKLVKEGEKGDVFISPGSTEMARLSEAGMVDDKAAKVVGTFELVVITNRESTLAIDSIEGLRNCRTISSPDPVLNSVGASGKQALTALGLWDELQPKMVFTKRAIQSHTMVAGRKSDAGIAYRNCPLETNPEKLSTSTVQVAVAFPEDSYDRQQCLVNVLKDAQNPTAAQAFVDFIASDEGRQILADKGMTGCLDMDSCTVEPGEDTEAVVSVRAFYPGNDAHEEIRNMIEGLSDEFDGKVTGEFTDFTSKDGFDKWQAAGLNCGAILINDEQTWSYEKSGKVVQVTFKMAMGGEWEKDDLYGVIDKLLAEQKAE